MNKKNVENLSQAPKLLLSGIDSLYVSYYQDGLGIDWENLDYSKELLKQDRRQEFLNISIGGKKWSLMPHGNFPYAYVLRNEYFQANLAKNNSPNCYVQFLSQALWTKGADWLHDWLLQWFDNLGCKPTRSETISCVDFAFDFDLPIVDFNMDHFVSRAVKDNIWRDHQEVQSYIFGAGEVVLRIYDKVAEIIQQSEKHWFYDLWGQNKDVWRVEFQIRRSRLKMVGLNSLSELNDFRGDILRELATGHTSLRQPTKDTNRSRWPYHLLWQSLLQAIVQENQTGLIETFRPENSLNYVLDRQLKSLYGDLKGLGALLSVMNRKNDPMTMETIIDRIPDLLERTHHPKLWTNDVQKRMDKRKLGK